jgi:hypothetical protein
MTASLSCAQTNRIWAIGLLTLPVPTVDYDVICKLYYICVATALISALLRIHLNVVRRL